MQIYPKSRHAFANAVVSMARGEATDHLVIEGENPGFEGAPQGGVLTAPLSHENAETLRRLFPFTAPQPILNRNRTIGLGDWVGLACPGQLAALARYDATPVLAQQSVYELSLERRTYAEVLDCVTFAVFREDFTRGFGADGDHLKTDDDVRYALSNGYTMITLDCGEQVRSDVAAMTDDEVDAAYEPDAAMEEAYRSGTFRVEGHPVPFPERDFRRACLTYGAALDHAQRIYETYLAGKPVDFEICIDESAVTTTPAQHFWIASELGRRNIRIATFAPHFCGEFQKGINYIGDLTQFEREFALHAAIARRFQYKLSVHSGSNKLSVFPIIGRLSEGRFHVKTSGIYWLAAMRVVAATAPALYREIHAFALTAFPEATHHYRVTTDLSKIPALDTLRDGDLSFLFTQKDVCQLLHITYGQILGAKNADGSSRFEDRLRRLWRENDVLYTETLDEYLTKHLALLYRDIPKQDL